MDTYNTNTTELEIKFWFPDVRDRMFSELRSLSNLELHPSASSLENAKDILGFTHNLFSHDGNNKPSATDPLTILIEAKAGQSFRCVEYSILATGLLWAYGIPARTLGLKTRDVETREYGAGHVVIEFWNSETKNWIMCDIQAGVIMGDSKSNFSAYELRAALDAGTKPEYTLITHSRFDSTEKYQDRYSYIEWIKQYLYFIDTPVHLSLGNEDRQAQQIVMLVPLNVRPPKIFQGMFKMNALYTHSIIDFYPPM